MAARLEGGGSFSLGAVFLVLVSGFGFFFYFITFQFLSLAFYCENDIWGKRKIHAFS